MNAQIQLVTLVAVLKAAKAAEQQASETRLAIESQILAHFPHQDEATIKEGDLTICYKLTRTVDTTALQSAWQDLPANAQKAFTWKAALDLKNFRAIADLDKMAFDAIIPFVSSKQAKPTLSFKEA